jgi:hypothetical protein
VNGKRIKEIHGTGKGLDEIPKPKPKPKFKLKLKLILII